MCICGKKGDYVRQMYRHTLQNDHFLCLFVDLPGGTVGYPAHPILICLSSVSPPVTSLLSILQKIARAQQIW